MKLEIIVGLLVLFAVAWFAGPAPPDYRGPDFGLRR
jgi:hypothetical protein